MNTNTTAETATIGEVRAKCEQLAESVRLALPDAYITTPRAFEALFRAFVGSGLHGGFFGLGGYGQPLGDFRLVGVPVKIEENAEAVRRLAQCLASGGKSVCVIVDNEEKP